MAKCVHLTSVHNASDVRIFHKQCRSLAAAGHEVVLIAPADADDLIDGVRLRAVAPTRKRLRRMTVTCGRVLRAALAEDADLYHFHDPELIPVGLWLRARGKQVIYDVHEDVPKQILAKHWLPHPVRHAAARCFAALEAAAERAWSGIVTATPPIAERFRNPRTVAVHNYSFREESTGRLADSGAAGSPAYDVAYVGAIATTRGVRELLAAVAQLAERRSIRLGMAGRFMPESLEAEARRQPGWQQVDYLGWRPHGEVRQLLAQSRIGVVPLHPLPRYVESQPVKLFEYMAAGIPVVASDFPLWREIVDGAQCGLLIPPEDPHALAEAIAWLLDHPAEAAAMGERGRVAARRDYSWENEAVKLTQFYEELLGETDHPMQRAAA